LTEAEARPSRWESLFAPFARVTSSGRYLPEIDGLRFIAISIVFLQHFQQALVSTAPRESQPVSLWVLENAHLGVELFFVLSGFILGLPFVLEQTRNEAKVSLRAYFLRRLTRLEPPYILSLILFAAYRVYHPLVPVEPTKVLEHALASLFYVHNWSHGPWHPRAINTVTWSLEIEVQFYVLAPLFALVFRWPAAVRRIVIVVVSALASLVATKLQWSMSILQFLPYFGMGFILADLHAARWRRALDAKHLDRFVWDGISLVSAFLALMFSCTRGIPTDHTLLAFLLFLFAFSSMRSRWVRAFLQSAPIRTIGGMCYSIYLLHWVLIWVAWRWLAITPSAANPWQTLTMGALLFLALMPVFALYFVLVEKPCMRAGWWRTKRAKPTAT
jgi:peptidoglycan/LPS O-acetylase OafA/YrhL